MIEWASVHLAVFDVDGTLYDQRALRQRMIRLLISDCLKTRSLSTIRLLASYRRRRELLADQRDAFSEDELLGDLAASHGSRLGEVRSIVEEWIHRRPLEELRRLRYPGVAELFHILRKSGRILGVLSDHPAREKLRALELDADHILSADDDDVKMLKPNPLGLRVLMAKSNASPEQTVMIGDRPDRDGEMGRRANVRTYIRSQRALPGWSCFESFEHLLPDARSNAGLASDVEPG